MKKIFIYTLILMLASLALMLSACSTTAPQHRSTRTGNSFSASVKKGSKGNPANWHMTQKKVAKVSKK